MKLTERLEMYHEQTRPPHRNRAAQIQRGRERREVFLAKIEAAREKLCEEDRLLLRHLHVSKDRAKRRELALELAKPTGSGRVRQRWEIAAMIGVSRGTVQCYLTYDPDGERARVWSEVKRTANPGPGRRPSFSKLVKLEPPDEPVGTRIHRYRRIRNWSRRKLADELGVSPSVVEGWESGATKPTPSQYALIARALDL